MSRNQIVLIVIGGALILFGIPLTLYLLSQQQDPRSRASEVIYPDNVNFAQQQPTPTSGASTQQTCEAPTSPTNTDISYPYDDGELVDLNQAGCSWDVVASAVSYNVKVTDINTSTVVRDDIVPSSTTTAVFPVTQGNTYLCEVSAVSSCGAVSAVSSDQQVCETEAFISPSPSPTPIPPSTAPPTATPLPTTPDVPTPTTEVKPPPPPTGAAETLVIAGGITAAIIAFGAALFIW